MLRCKEVAEIIAGDELEAARWTLRLGVRMHLLMCVHCRRYERQLKMIGRTARSILGPSAEDQDPAVLGRLERAILGSGPGGPGGGSTAGSTGPLSSSPGPGTDGSDTPKNG